LKKKANVEHTSLTRLEIIVNQALDRLKQDVVEGKDEQDRGWMTQSELEGAAEDIEFLTHTEVLEKGVGEKIRFKWAEKNEQFRGRKGSILYKLKEKILFIENLILHKKMKSIDEQKFQKAVRILRILQKMLSEDPSIWGYVVGLGLNEMFRSSGMPVRIDDALEKGFSPETWMKQAIASCPHLSLIFANKFHKIKSFAEVEHVFRNYLEGSANNVQRKISQTDVAKIMEVLKYSEILNRIQDETLQTIGFFWAIFVLLKSKGLLPITEEINLKIDEQIWNTLEAILRKSKEEMLNIFRKDVENLSGEIPWIHDIFRLPELIS